MTQVGTLEQAIREHVALVQARAGPARPVGERFDDLPIDITAPVDGGRAPPPPRPPPRSAAAPPLRARRGVPIPALALLAIGALGAMVASLPGLQVGANGQRSATRAPPGGVAGTSTQASADPWAGAGSRALFPFAPSHAQRVPGARDALPAFTADGRTCAVGCRPAGAIAGWPLRPFHRVHALRAGLNERRPSGFHAGLDIEARDGQRVYALQPGRARILQTSGADSRVRVGNYVYWHLRASVTPGQRVTPYRTVLGTVRSSAGHLHLSEVTADGANLNPLRPGGRVLSPWRDTAPPVIGRPHLAADGSVGVSAFDPQSTHVRRPYATPVLAPAALAYAVFDTRGRRVVRLRWALRGSHQLPSHAIPLVYGAKAHSPGWGCFVPRRTCVPDWSYRLAGGLAPRLSALALSSGRYRLAVYAWDWAGNVAARDRWFDRTAAGVRPAA